MKTLTSAILGAMLIAAGAAYAANATYTETVQKIDKTMAAGKFSASTTDEARRLKGDADRMMKEGKEAEAMKLLEQVKQLLNMK
jgi:hypothetical protein